jgi:hypothetical protein
MSKQPSATSPIKAVASAPCFREVRGAPPELGGVAHGGARQRTDGLIAPVAVARMQSLAHGLGQRGVQTGVAGRRAALIGGGTALQVLDARRGALHQRHVAALACEDVQRLEGEVGASGVAAGSSAPQLVVHAHRGVDPGRLEPIQLGDARGDVRPAGFDGALRQHRAGSELQQHAAGPLEQPPSPIERAHFVARCSEQRIDGPHAEYRILHVPGVTRERRMQAAASGPSGHPQYVMVRRAARQVNAL